MDKHSLGAKEKLSYGLGAVGKDMVYMLSASYVLYYYQDILGVSPVAMGVILMAARVFDAFNDPVMGVIVAKTKTRWGKFRPWLLIGTLTNAVVLYIMFSAPPSLDGAGLTAYAAAAYILWGVTYTMMDIPYWSMIPAFTEGGRERESLTTLARSCAGVGSAIITILTMIAVQNLGRAVGGPSASAREVERLGFQYFSLAVAVIFVLLIVFTCVSIREKSTVDMETASVGQMFRALLSNDQTLTVVVAIVLINCSVYITSNLVIYFFKYDFGGSGWYNAYTLFNIFGGAVQIFSMMLFYPFLRRFMNSLRIFYVSLGMAAAGYLVLLALAFTDMSSVFLLFIPAFFIFAANGMLTVIVTVFLANTVDYGELKNGRRDESVIFSMQTFVVKLASGFAAFAASVCLQVFSLSSEAASEAEQTMDFSASVAQSSRIGLRMTMTLLPIAGLIFAFFWFRKHYILTDEKLAEISEKRRESSLESTP
ncbi:MAG: glycoside-pentoside-hexuronide (GPH):cation symporter [Lachnospiraceae bacterium]|nr:glycoside-pentoside-hexuronide (GPH):cation symporter [Lachnospiraceae bacterium]